MRPSCVDRVFLVEFQTATDEGPWEWARWEAYTSRGEAVAGAMECWMDCGDGPQVRMTGYPSCQSRYAGDLAFLLDDWWDGLVVPVAHDVRCGINKNFTEEGKRKP